MLADLGLQKMSACGIRSPGHEGAGVVVKLGSTVTNWKVGDRAGVKPVFNTCGKCDLCWDDKESYCKKAQWTGLGVPGKFTAGQCRVSS